MLGRRTFSTSSSLRATLHPTTTTITHDLHFPTTPHPTPFEIFHLSPTDKLTSSSVKARYYELCKLYHPDLQQNNVLSSNSSKGKGKAKTAASAHADPQPQATSSSSSSSSESSGSPSDPSSEFKQIVAAYELLRNPSRRAAYLHSGDGWTTPPTFRGSGGRNANGDAMGYPVHFRRGRPVASSARRPTYSSSAYDWHMSGAAQTGWTDPYDSFWSSHPRERNGTGSGTGGEGTSSTADFSSSGWKHQGHVGRNGTIFLALATLTMFATPLVVWSSSPTSLTSSTESGWMPVVQDRRHRDASLALETARKEARKDSEAKREAIKRRVQQIEYARAIERADQVERIARGKLTTGHDQLPRPRTTQVGAKSALLPPSSPSSSSSTSSHCASGVS